ncbi:hypothetical protein GBAR_LOCUS24296 [Geodia barretti]|uniref:Uncharacterized protein n=1 Tax=Geodia barretti TaxID=519541 RepID=A0AA35T9L6_GEOBA|nr:hypothetical protein GBAR_LOCUS24296 [Geodia barretti]
MIEGCLNFPEDRPCISEVLHLLEEARIEVRDGHASMNKLELLQNLQNKPGSESLESGLQSRLQEIHTELELKKKEIENLKFSVQKLHSSNQGNERDLLKAHQQLRQKEAQLTRKGAELAETRQKLRQKLRCSEALVADFQKALQLRDSEAQRSTVVIHGQ